ncbi:MAG: beta-propeller fold lactonase family protein, partial [Acidobacteriota bacterium]|nr:beta-propeller fold lactonase family protein [Acidobacteriota bacterium]
MAAGWSNDFLTVFARDTSAGTLTFLETHEDGVAGVDGLRGESRVALDPDGAHVYVSSDIDHSVALFARDTSAGTLTFRRIYEDTVDGQGLSGATGLALSGDGEYLFVASRYSDALSVFRRNATSGELSFVEWHRDGVDGVDGLDNAQAVAVSPDGTHVYVVTDPRGLVDGKTALFSRVSTSVADLSITKSDSMDPVAAGGAFDYTLSVTNAGPGVAWGVRVEDTLPPGVSLTDATGTGWNCAENGGLVTCSSESLDVGVAPVLTLSVTAPFAGTGITNTALVEADSFDPDGGDNSASEQTALLPILAIDDVTVIESDSGTVDAIFTVSLSAASGQTVTVDYATADGTASAGSDYQAGSGTATIPAGSPSGTVPVLVNGDTLDELDETFFVNLSNPSNATISDAQGRGTITDDEHPLIIVKKQTIPGGDPGVFPFTGDLAGLIGDGERLLLSPPPGTYTSTELVPGGWSLFKCTCNDSDSVGNMGTETVTIELGAGESVICVFANCAESVAWTLDLA